MENRNLCNILLYPKINREKYIKEGLYFECLMKPVLAYLYFPYCC